MAKTSYYQGIPGKKYGIWDSVDNCWKHDVCEDTPCWLWPASIRRSDPGPKAPDTHPVCCGTIWRVLYEKAVCCIDLRLDEELTQELEAAKGQPVAFMKILVESQKHNEEMQKVSDQIDRLLRIGGAADE